MANKKQERGEGDPEQGSLIGIVIIIIILGLGAYYLFSSRQDNPTVLTPEDMFSGYGASDASTTEAVLMYQSQSNSDELSDIEQDLNATDMQALEGDISDSSFQ